MRCNGCEVLVFSRAGGVPKGTLIGPDNVDGKSGHLYLAPKRTVEHFFCEPLKRKNIITGKGRLAIMFE